MKKVKKIFKKPPYNKKKKFNFVTKKKTNFQHVIKAENSILFRCLLLAKYLTYKRRFKKMIAFFKPKKHLKTITKFKEKNNMSHLSGPKNRKMTYSYKMFKFIKQQNRSKPTIKKDYLLGNYNFFYLFFLFKNLNSDEQTSVLKKKIYNFLKINFSIIATKSKLINKGPKAFKFLFFLLKMQQNKKKTIKKKKTLRKNIFFRLKFNKKILKKLNRKKNAIMQIRYKKKVLFHKIMKLTFGSKRRKTKKKKSVKKLVNGRVWLRKRAYIYRKRIRRSKSRRRKTKKWRRLCRNWRRRRIYKKTKYIRRRRRLRLLARKRSNFFKQKKNMYQCFKKYSEARAARAFFAAGRLKISSTYKKQKKTKKLLKLKAPFFFFFWDK